MLSLTFCVLLFSIQVRSANILGVFNIPSVSHQVVFQPIWRELSLRGHKVTIMSPNPVNDSSLTNLTEIDMNFLYKDVVLLDKEMAGGMDHWHWTRAIDSFIKVHTKSFFSYKKVQDLINDNSSSFDLVLVEALYPAAAAFAIKFNCPLIGIASLDVPSPVHDLLGNPGHSVLYPDLSTTFKDDMTFFEKVDAVLFYWYHRYMFFYHTFPNMDKVIRQYFGSSIPDLKEICKNMSMVLLNTNPIVHKPRPYGPNTIEMGGRMHLKQKKPLPAQLKQYLDNSTEGVIYFSLGSNVKSALLDANKRKILTEVFSQLPYKVLWKFETDHLENQPENVKISKWLPQNDLLGHPNVKLFITQGGLQSFDESVANGVPLLAIPFFADQFINAGRIVELGIGQQIDFTTLTSESFKSSILEIIGNKKYKENIIGLRKLFNDESMTGLQKAIWWIEYVIRNKGAAHFRNRVVDMSWFEFLLIDVYSFLLFTCVVVSFIVYQMLKFLVSSLVLYRSNKLKKI